MILTTGGVEVLRGAVGEELDGGECVAQALFDKVDGQVGDVDLGPLPPEFIDRMNSGVPGLKEAFTLHSRLLWNKTGTTALDSKTNAK